MLLLFSHCQQVTSLAAAVRAPYLCALPSASYFSAIGHPLTVAAAAYLCDCDPLDHGTHDTSGILLLVASFLYKELHKTALGKLFRVSLWVRVPLETLYERKHPDDKGLSLYWYAIETLAVAGYQ